MKLWLSRNHCYFIYYRTRAIDSRIARTFPSSPVVSISAASCTSSVNQSTYRLPGCRHFHTSSRKNDKFDPEEIKNPFFSKIPENWLKYNEIVYPPQKPGEPKRPAVSFFASLQCWIYIFFIKYKFLKGPLWPWLFGSWIYFNLFSQGLSPLRGCHDHMVIGFITTYAISAYHH